MAGVESVIGTSQHEQSMAIGSSSVVDFLGGRPLLGGGCDEVDAVLRRVAGGFTAAVVFVFEVPEVADGRREPGGCVWLADGFVVLLAPIVERGRNRYDTWEPSVCKENYVREAKKLRTAN